MLKKILLTAAMLVFASQSGFAKDDYHNYGDWNIGGQYGIYNIGGYIDNAGKFGGNNGDEYVIFQSGSKGYVYRVTVNGDPNAHPDANGLPIAPRTFKKVSESNGTLPFWGGGAEFYVDDTGIYCGNGRKILKWDHHWGNKTTVVNPTNPISGSETLAKNASKNEWWTADRYRNVYKYNKSTNTWVKQFQYPDLGGSHQDGMEIVNGKLYLSDMTTDKIIVYDLNETTGDVIADSNKTYTYTATEDVEGMGYGPNQHFWMSAGKAYEVGSGKLIAKCQQTFYYNTTWGMDMSKCNNITVPGIDDAVMVMLKVVGGKPELQFATADKGAKSWLKARGFTVKDSFTLQTGQGFFTLGKRKISQKITTGKAQNGYVNFTKGIITFVGFTASVDLNDKFGSQPVDKVYYFDTKWHIWKPSDGSQVVSAAQGLYVLPNGDFGMTVK